MSEFRTIRELCSVVVDCPHSTPKWTANGKIVIRNKNIKHGKIDFSSPSYTDDEHFAQRIKRAKPQPGDIIITREAPIGDVGMIPENTECCLGQRMVLLRANQSVCDNFYLLYSLQSLYVQHQISWSEGTGTTVSNLRIPHLEQIQIPYLPLEQQAKISSVLRALEEKIENNRRLNDNLLGQMQALYRSWFVDFLPFGGSKPRTWTETDIYSLANIIYGAPFKSKQFNTDGVGTPIIRIRDLKDQQFATYTTEIHPKGYLLQPGDIVVGMDGEFRPYIWGNDGAWLNQRVCVFENKRPNGKAFLYFTIKPLLYGIEQTQVATTVIHIGKKDFDAFEITLPDASTLDDFDALTTPMMRVIVSNCFENKRLAALRDILLPKLMSGEIDVSDIQL